MNPSLFRQFFVCVLCNRSKVLLLLLWFYFFILQNVTLYENCKCVETQGEKTKVACQMNCGFEPWWFLLVLSVVVAVMFLNDTASVIVILRYLKISFYLLCSVYKKGLLPNPAFKKKGKKVSRNIK